MSKEFKRLCRAWVFSWQGFKAAWRHEAAFRDEVLLSIIIIPLACWLGDGGVQHALLMGSWLLVPLVELLNSAIEAIVDRIGLEQHELSGRAKDLGSAAVVLAIVIALVVWGCVLL